MSPEIVCDTSVLVAAFSTWHDAHDTAIPAVRRSDALVEHVALETFSVLTRLPPPRRVPPDLAAVLLDTHYPEATPRLPTPASRDILQSAVGTGITGGAVYDLTVAVSAAAADVTILSLDRRAARTYEAAGVRFELLS